MYSSAMLKRNKNLHLSNVKVNFYETKSRCSKQASGCVCEVLFDLVEVCSCYCKMFRRAVHLFLDIHVLCFVYCTRTAGLLLQLAKRIKK